MSLLISDSNDGDAMISLSPGCYRYNDETYDITDITNGKRLYVNHVLFNTSYGWVNKFVIAPLTKVTLYTLDQSVIDNRYQGDMLIICNYNYNKNGYVYVDLNEYIEGINMIDNIKYIVVTELDKVVVKRKSKRNKQQFTIKYYNAEQHTKRLQDEPLALNIYREPSTYNFNDVLMVVIMLIVTSIIFYATFTFATTKSKQMYNNLTATIV